jgi:hypothetical protein
MGRHRRGRRQFFRADGVRTNHPHPVHGRNSRSSASPRIQVIRKKLFCLLLPGTSFASFFTYESSWALTLLAAGQFRIKTVKDFSFGAYTLGGKQRYSARNVIRPTNFMFHDRAAKRVSVIGDFNDWHPDAHPMRNLPDGGWYLQIPLSHGHHHYLFLIDGQKRVMDPRAQGVARNEMNEKVSLIAVS